MSQLDTFQRYFILIQKIRRVPYCTKSELIQYLIEQSEPEFKTDRGLSDRSFDRHISKIKCLFGISIEYCRTNKGYFIPEDEGQDTIIETILEPLNLLHAMVGVDRHPEYVYVEKRRSIGTEYLAEIMRAIKLNKYISIRYSIFYPEVTDVKVIQPHAVKESRGRWYVLAYEKGGTTLKSPLPTVYFPLNKTY